MGMLKVLQERPVKTDAELAADLDQDTATFEDLGARSGPMADTYKERAAKYRRAAHVLRAAAQMEKALEACRKYIPGSEVRNWPPGHRLRDEALKSSFDALAAYREI